MTHVKICGIMSLEEALAARRAGAWAIGEVFAPSRRQIELEQAAKINRELGNSVVRIGVFVDEDLDTLKGIIQRCSLDMVQLHGEEAPEYLEKLPVPAIKAFRVKGPLEIDEIKRWRPWAYLFDSYSPAASGGTGSIFNWECLHKLKGHERIILAGGLDANNVGKAIREVRPMAVDVSSGVEFAGGGKDSVKIEAFMRRVKEADLDGRC